ncbi:MAG: aryl-sulfate sulfotransferase, partial [Bacteroidia bacterium]|nr:aryl-sulfate sulfotransferase [Bacteroidia bacterium]
MKKLISVLLIIGAIFSLTISFAQTVGLMLHNPETEDGYVLFAPSAYNKTYLIDKCGKLVHTWTSGYNPGLAVYLLNNGKLLRTGNTSNTTFNSGGKGGIIELLDTNSTVQWSYLISNAMECQHHDIYPLPNGNILAIVWEKKSQAEAIAEGRNPALLGTSLWSEKIIEVQPTGSSTGIIVWQWHVWDHLIQDYSSVQPNFGIVSLHPELINLNYYTGTATQADWLHINAISYNPSFNQIMISSHNFSEIWIIDHSTTSSEAASHIGGTYGKGGDLLYRWGNPAAYNRGTVADKKFFGQHNPHWITPGYRDENNILVFNNGLNRPVGNYSSVEILSLPVDTLGNYSVPVSAPFLPDSAYWKYIAPVPTDFYSNNISGAQRLSNGNTIICEGNKGNYFEIDTNNIIVWKYVNPVNNTGPVTQNTSITNNSVFRCTQIPFGYAGLNGYNLSQGSPVELNPLPYACSMTSV